MITSKHKKIYMQGWYQIHKFDKPENERRDARYKKNYGISYLEVLDILKRQENACPICNKRIFLTHNQKTSAVVDHCHKTNKVRGILCANCNRAIGLLYDSIDNLNNAMNYLTYSY